MNSERANQIAEQCVILHTVDENTMRVISAHVIAETIMYACAEEREACAKNMDEAAEDVAEWGAYAPAYFQDKWNLQKAIKKWKDRAAAIRGGA